MPITTSRLFPCTLLRPIQIFYYSGYIASFFNYNSSIRLCRSGCEAPTLDTVPDMIETNKIHYKGDYFSSVSTSTYRDNSILTYYGAVND
ncbi:hypothetical protein NEPAR06_1916 [Nematocida parisii]|uniref:Uncharacterized protein n=1 Tax=Nematocida parisii (strain ERTm3) TaxID=935791 RepID=I3EF13_NEMP3|nr:uncharacterized protein NEPG_01988 [Nematocida parisii ERTm1]EIJ87810.1 hypothetical protein NEQG_01882 [Nematocida parisii ERTm3]KAI5129237.1 hypothetical protein NEPAR03_1598 [Nematocida parisii]EIJ93032.1 hypothetical protein NEPG_01988 [Nematocida parisii ERTm1]KAI5129415.1 hypothetical protein NEPAR08_1565 [Nematocida parisii]KAI5141970.1 hypothetical protein NEPAR04_1326 [Nematocida parisii]|eukprot:XP_013059815.1 hypothetical protein NEPG_01988 [Nematocida parisii ERTm1]